MRRHLSGSLPGLLALLLFALIPYSLAAVTGQPEEGLSGVARIHSAAESVYCQEGLNPAAVALLVEMGLMLGAVIIGGRRPAADGQRPFFSTDGWHLLAVMALVAIPFVIAWRTDSSVCRRGDAFFWQSIFVDVFILAILAMSYNLMFGFTGVVSFGHAAFFGSGAYLVGLLMLHLQWPWWTAVLAALTTGALIALVKGVVGLRIRGLYFALFTLAFAEIFFLLAGNRILVNLTGAEDGFTFAVPDWLNSTKNRLFFYYLTLVALVFSFWLIRRLVHSPTGRVMAALRDNEARAQMLGYNTFYFKLIAIVLAGVMATGAGVLRGLALKGASPNVLGLDFTINPLLMTIVGGQGTFVGPVVGAFGLHLVEQALRDTVLTIGGLEVNVGERWALILGLVFILSVLVFPYGIVGTWQLKGLHTRAGWRRLLRRSTDLSNRE
ncbi:MAG: branched-chain amino acid ABC transporter permease [Chloroflexota bacterium]